ncbi:MAG: hypothetical protein ACRC1T_05700 [Clostridium chrysemydis]|uniref:hypothetical protein n=1 Tax=Clostridium chrysemydis TaxID=2665504 RepID=UPI003F2ED009
MIELLKSIDIENMSIRMIKETINDVREELGTYLYSNNCSQNAGYNIYKIQSLMDRTDIIDLSFKELTSYISKLIVLIEFAITN